MTTSDKVRDCKSLYSTRPDCKSARTDYYCWNRFREIFNSSNQKNNLVSISLSRSLQAPFNANILPAFNFFQNGFLIDF